MIDIKKLNHEAWCDCINNISEYCNCNLSCAIELIQNVQAENAKLREGLAFYADKNNWLSIQAGYGNQIMISLKDKSYPNEHDDSTIEVGGKLARQILKEVEDV